MKKSIPEIREREGNEKIHSHNSGKGIRGFHSWEWTGTGIPAHPWLEVSFVCCNVVWFQISVELIAWVASMLKLLEFLWCEYLFVIFVIMGVDCCKSCWGFPKEMSSLQRRQWWCRIDNHTMTMKITLRQWQWHVNHTMTMKEKMIARTTSYLVITGHEDPPISWGFPPFQDCRPHQPTVVQPFCHEPFRKIRTSWNVIFFLLLEFQNICNKLLERYIG